MTSPVFNGFGSKPGIAKRNGAVSHTLDALSLLLFFL
jgi:hypothetical protein